MFFNRKKIFKYDIEQMTQARRALLLAGSFALIVIWSSYAVLQSNLILLSKLEIYRLSQLLEIIALCASIIFLLCSIMTIYQEKNKAKAKSLTKEIECSLDSHANKIDCAGSVIALTMQLFSVLYMLSILNWYPGINNENEIFNLQNTIEIVGSLCFLVSSSMALVSSIVKNNKEKETYNCQNKKLINPFIGMFVGTFTMFCGKILCIFEAKNKISYTGSLGQLDTDKLPIGLSLRILGMVIFITFYALSFYLKDNTPSTLLQNEQISRSGEYQNTPTYPS